MGLKGKEFALAVMTDFDLDVARCCIYDSMYVTRYICSKLDNFTTDIDMHYRHGGLDIFDSYFNGRNMYKALYNSEASGEEIDRFMKRVEKYSFRMNYTHFRQFSKTLDFLSFNEYVDIKRRYNAPIANLMIGRWHRNN